MKVAILGASGYIGQNLIKYLLETTDYQILALSTHATNINIENPKLKKMDINVFNTNNLAKNLLTCDVAFYLIHMMGQENSDFEKTETLAAKSFCKAIIKSKIKRVIYLGGLGKDSDKLSKHLLSRHKTGEIIRQSFPNSIEFRASMTIGKGSVSYDIITNLVDKLPVLILPKWFSTLTQPIGLKDTLAYLSSSININISKSEVIEIGGPDKLSYVELMKNYARWKNKKVLFIILPLIPYGVASLWLNLLVPSQEAKIGIAMVKSLANPMLVTNNKAKILFPHIKPASINNTFV